MEKKHSSYKARERKLRAQYRKKLWAAVIICLIIGLAAGFVLGRMTSSDGTLIPSTNATPTSTADTELALTTAEATASPTPEPESYEVIVAEGEAQTVSVEIYSDGSVRTEDDTLPYETLDFSIEVTRYLSVEYYEETYGDTYQISNDTAVEFELLLNDYTGSQTITPNSLFKFTLETESGDTISGYRLTDAEINGQSDFTVTTNIPTMLYKRFEYDSTVGEAKYLVVTTYVGGVPTTYKFELGESISPTPEPTVEITYSTLNKGETSDDIKTMQTRLIELGYLEESNDTGYYGDLTAAAVSEAQAAFGLEETGIADNEFLQLLYADDDAEEAEATVTATAATSTSD